MQFLSIAGRELRVAARKRSSFRLRMLTSSIALLMTGFALYFVIFLGSKPVSGEALFLILSWVAFICACIVGPALTADCVNEERNNGTLGLLFLTNLRAASITLGKLAGHGLLAFYSIVSIVPIMALPALLGGTDAQTLARTALVLLATLILSLLIGMFASTVCRKPWQAAALALILLAILVAGVPLAAAIMRWNGVPGWPPWIELLSPSFSLVIASSSAPMLAGNPLGLALTVQAVIACLLFGMINYFLPRIWREGKSGRKGAYLFSIWRKLKFGSGEATRALRARLLRINPILWLSCRERFGPMSHAIVLLALAFAISQAGKHVRAGPTPDGFIDPMMAWILGIPVLYLLFCFRLVAAASERFAADRKAGAMELILCTPMKTSEIIRGHWLGLVRRFWGAAALLLGLHLFVLHYIIEANRILGPLPPYGWRAAIVGPLRHVLGVGSIPNAVAPFYIASLAVFTAAILIVVLWIALGWLGMALSLKLRREILVPWAALLALAVPPIPLFIGVLPLFDKKLFATDLFTQLLKVGASGFFIVLANALLWGFLARRWTYEKLRVGASASAHGSR